MRARRRGQGRPAVPARLHSRSGSARANGLHGTPLPRIAAAHRATRQGGHDRDSIAAAAAPELALRPVAGRVEVDGMRPARARPAASRRSSLRPLSGRPVRWHPTAGLPHTARVQTPEPFPPSDPVLRARTGTAGDTPSRATTASGRSVTGSPGSPGSSSPSRRSPAGTSARARAGSRSASSAGTRARSASSSSSSASQSSR